MDIEKLNEFSLLEVEVEEFMQQSENLDSESRSQSRFVHL